MANTDAEFVFVRNISYGHLNDELERNTTGSLRVGPVLDPNTGEYKPQWPVMVGMYAMCNATSVPGEARILKDRDGRRITLERALRIATPTIADLLD